MQKEIIYPKVEKIIEYNLLALKFIKAKKADTPKVMSKSAILNTIYSCEDCSGDIYDKAIFLLKGIVQKHPFASGNRRTAIIVVKEFLLTNKQKFNVEGNPEQAKVMQGIREGYYSDEEIKEWLKNGKIKEFRR